MDANYEKALIRLSKAAGLDKEEIERKVEAKRAKLSGLISREGALQVITAELGISFDDQKSKIDELLPGMRKVNTIGKVIRLFPVREFTTKKGDPGKVVNLVIADDTSNIRIVLWDIHHIALIENGGLKEGDVIEIIGGSMRDNEIHLGSFSEIKKSGQTFDEVQTEKTVHEKNIIDFRISDSASVRGFIVQAFDPRFFFVCPECKKKANQEGEGYTCGEHGSITPEKRALINVVVDDGTESIRAVMFHEILNKVGLKEYNDETVMQQQKQGLLGKEFIFKGNVRMNSYFNNPEFIIDGVEEINLDSLLESLEK